MLLIGFIFVCAGIRVLVLMQTLLSPLLLSCCLLLECDICFKPVSR